MKKLLLFFAITSSINAAAQTVWQQAQITAKADHKLILLTFSGSDWCIPCIRQEKAIFEQASFNDFAKTNLVLLKADFPRLQKHQLSKEIQKQNEALAEKYNANGTFPFTVLTDADGQVLKTWEGEVATSPQVFIKQIEAFRHAR